MNEYSNRNLNNKCFQIALLSLIVVFGSFFKLSHYLNVESYFFVILLRIVNTFHKFKKFSNVLAARSGRSGDSLAKQSDAETSNGATATSMAQQAPPGKRPILKCRAATL